MLITGKSGASKSSGQGMPASVLLLTASPPGSLGVGQLFLKSQCVLADFDIAVAALLGCGEEYSLPSSLKNCPNIYLTRCYEPAIRPLNNLLGNLTATAGVQLWLKPHVKRLSKSIHAFVAQNPVEAIWAVLECPTTMLLAAPLAKHLGLPLFCLVWDMPDYLLPRLGHRGISYGLIYQGFKSAICHSQKVAVMSSAMQKKIEQEYATPCVILHQPIDPAWLPEHKQETPLSQKEDLVIGFAGSVTAKTEMSTLLSALDSVNWELCGRKVKLRIFGLRFVCQSRHPQKIEYCGYLPDIKDVVGELAKCDVLFLPQPFDSSLKSFSVYSFPTKTVTYLAAGKPILVLAPEESTIFSFFKRKGLSSLCIELSSTKVLSTLKTLFNNADYYCSETKRIQELRNQEFTQELCSRRLRDLFTS